jgi:hypothetical protein
LKYVYFLRVGKDNVFGFISNGKLRLEMHVWTGFGYRRQLSAISDQLSGEVTKGSRYSAASREFFSSGQRSTLPKTADR